MKFKTYLDWKFRLFTRRGQIKGSVLEKFNPKVKNYVKSKFTPNVLSQISKKKESRDVCQSDTGGEVNLTFIIKGRQWGTGESEQDTGGTQSDKICHKHCPIKCVFMHLSCCDVNDIQVFLPTDQHLGKQMLCLTFK